MSSSKRAVGAALLSTALLRIESPAEAQVGDPQLRTNHQYFPGELAMSTPARAVNHAMVAGRGSVGSTSNRDKLIRLFLWRSETFAHNYSPAVYNLPGVQPNPLAGNQLMTDFDAMRTLFSYGFGLCGTNHAHMRVFAEQAGWQSRRRGLVGDTGHELLVDGKWRYVNTDQYTLHFQSNSSAAHFASLDEVINTNHHFVEWNPDLGLGYRLPQANTHDSYQDFAGQTGIVRNRSLQWRDYYANVWKVPAGGSIAMYGEGFTATPIVVRLRRGEKFTRYFDPNGAVSELGLAGTVWWGFNSNNGASPKGPLTTYSFVQNAPARDEVPGGVEESRKNARFGNAVFDWEPNLNLGEHNDGAVATTGSLQFGTALPRLRSSGASSLTLSQYTPYTIGGRPSDGVDPAKSASDGAVLYGTATGSIPVQVSVNAGATWASVGTLSSMTTRLDFTNTVKGRNHYLVRLSFDNGEGLDTLRLRTIGIMNPGVYPTLRSGSSTINYAAGNVGALDLSPPLSSSAADVSLTGYSQRVASSANVSGRFYASGNAWAFTATDANPMWVVYRITMPPQLASKGATWKRLFAAADVSLKVPPTSGAYGKIEISTSQSGPWTQIGSYSPPTNNQLSHGWVYGSSSASGTFGGTIAYVRYSTYNPGSTARLRFLALNATYTMPAAPTPVEVSFRWNNGTSQTSTRTIAPGTPSASWSITTGSVVTQNKVVIRVPSR